jgi:hypothetical protein
VTLTYVYCLVRAARRPAIPDAKAGVIGSRDLRALDAGNGLWMIASTVAASEYDESALERGLQNLEWVSQRAVGHESVVERFMSSRAVLPMQLFRLYLSDERALAHISRQRRAIDRALARVEGHCEFGVRLTLAEDAVGPRAPGRARPGAITSGADYLSRKRDLLHAGRAALASARGEANRLYRTMSREATRARRRTETEEASSGSRLLLDAVFLVPSRRIAAFRSALRTHTRTLGATGVVVSVTGPWPPYNFLDSRRKKGSA